MANQGEDEIQEEAGVPTVRIDPMQYQAMMADVTRMIRQNLEFYGGDNAFPRGFDPPAGRFGRGARMRPRRRARPDAAEEHADASEYSGGDSPAEGAHPRHHHQRRRAEDNLGSLKLRIPPFLGKNDPDAYLEWEKKIEMVFSCQQFSEEKKVRLAATEFSGYAVNWWDQIATTRRRNGELQVASWYEMKAVMRKRFVPTHYGRELHQRLRKLNQGTRSVEDYHQEMEDLIIKAELVETPEAKMARFQGGLNRELQDRLELQEYEDMDELLHKATLIEQQLKRRSSTRGPYVSPNRPPATRDERAAPYRPKEVLE